MIMSPMSTVRRRLAQLSAHLVAAVVAIIISLACAVVAVVGVAVAISLCSCFWLVG